ncbi:MAG: single-stranded DNA-binding protein [Actinomycetota bacterium]|nr:single-stranded DNA-binding protein [Actinomycetota bacterium]
MNQVTLVGNLTDDPEFRYTQGGLAVANFTVAVSRRVPKGDGWEDATDGFFRCVAWRSNADNAAQTLCKGMRVFVVGRLSQRSWEDEAGNKRSTIEIHASHVGPDLQFATAEVMKPTQADAAA